MRTHVFHLAPAAAELELEVFQKRSLEVYMLYLTGTYVVPYIRGNPRYLGKYMYLANGANPKADEGYAVLPGTEVWMCLTIPPGNRGGSDHREFPPKDSHHPSVKQ
jgi:hypothetical protein